jgi:hypothetical protein
MTVSTSTRIAFDGDDLTTEFEGTFTVAATDDFGVALTDEDGVVALQILGTDYTVVLDDDGYPTITMVTAPATDEKLVLYPMAPVAQGMDVTNSAFGSQIEQGMDDLARAIQAVNARVDTCIRVPASDPIDETTDLNDLVDRVDGVLMFDEDGQPFVSTVASLAVELEAESIANEAIVACFVSTTSLLAAYGASATGVPVAARTVGRTSAGDKGGGMFWYNSSDTTSSDNLGTIRVDAQNRRWYAMMDDGVLYTAMFGVKGDASTNDVAALQAAFDAGATLAGSEGRCQSVAISPTTAHIKCGSAVSFNPGKISLDGRGQSLNFGAVTAAITGLTIANGATSHTALTVAELNSRVSLENLRVHCPKYTDNASFVGVEIKSGSGGWNGCFVINNLTIMGGHIALKFGEGAWGGVINNLFIGHDATNTLDNAITFSSLYDGEDVTINHGLINGGLGTYIIDAPYSNSNLNLNNVHLDGATTVCRQTLASRVRYTGCYFEFTHGVDATWFIISDEDGYMNLTDCAFIPRNDLAVQYLTPMFTNTGLVVMNGVTFRRSASGQPYQANGGFLSSGTGRVLLVGNSVDWEDYNWGPLPDKFSTFNTYPDCDDSNMVDDFSLSNTGGGDDPVRAAAVTHSATRDCLRFKLNAGSVVNDDSVCSITRLLPHGSQGRRISFVCDAAGVLSTNTIFSGRATFKDASGGTLLINNVTMIAASGGNTNWGVNAIGMDCGWVPPGAVSVVMFVRLLATGSPAGESILDVSPMGWGFCT